MSTALAELIEKAVAKGAFEAFATTAERIGEELARDLLNDPEFRQAMRELAREAFRRAMVDLGKDRNGTE
jgi:metal-dependent amidase/aminoacylase/carboxypeptidase family protein